VAVAPFVLNLERRWSGQLHSPAFYSPWKCLPISYDRRLCPVQSRSGWFAEEKNLLPLRYRTTIPRSSLCLDYPAAENCAVLGYYAANNGNFLPMFRENLSVPSSGAQMVSACPSKTLVRTRRYARRLCHKTGIFISAAVRTSNLDLNSSNLRVYLTVCSNAECIASNGWMWVLNRKGFGWKRCWRNLRCSFGNYSDWSKKWSGGRTVTLFWKVWGIPRKFSVSVACFQVRN
jgi:hypothetical protein